MTGHTLSYLNSFVFMNPDDFERAKKDYNAFCDAFRGTTGLGEQKDFTLNAIVPLSQNYSTCELEAKWGGIRYDICDMVKREPNILSVVITTFGNDMTPIFYRMMESGMISLSVGTKVRFFRSKIPPMGREGPLDGSSFAMTTYSYNGCDNYFISTSVGTGTLDDKILQANFLGYSELAAEYRQERNKERNGEKADAEKAAEKVAFLMDVIADEIDAIQECDVDVRIIAEAYCELRGTLVKDFGFEE